MIAFERFSEQQKVISSLAIVIVSLLAIAWTSHKTFHILTHYQFSAPQALPGGSAGEENQPINNRVAAKLFGEFQAEHQNISQTGLDWTLIGIFKTQPKHKSHAIIENGQGEARQYLMGDEVESGIKLHDILDDRVILQRDGKYEALMIDPDSLKQAPVDEQVFDFSDFKER